MLSISSPSLVLLFYSTVLRSPIQRVHSGTYEYVRLNLMLGSVIHDCIAEIKRSQSNKLIGIIITAYSAWNRTTLQLGSASIGDEVFFLPIPEVQDVL
ncbi:hypothetical protein ARMGADRAFT_1018764 [Armillaria gallica]|uniref:Uncharacterized protein n=1 Tax=Armillaria gallica TaxID=47427 RepID=A0A2H3CM07_ARMGA|nr:hypothetical protein ARMGADRAFT_1018764 [Armillaria gallica]